MTRKKAAEKAKGRVSELRGSKRALFYRENAAGKKGTVALALNPPNARSFVADERFVERQKSVRRGEEFQDVRDALRTFPRSFVDALQ